MNPNFTVVLCRPEIPENIGSVARCMMTFGLDDLRIVESKRLAPESRAYMTARDAETILNSAKYFETLSDAVADCQQAFGFTRRGREKNQTVHELSEVEGNFEKSKTALVFGCESNGLAQDEILQATHLVRIASVDSELSLNLSHAVAIALYALVPQYSKSVEQVSDRPTLGESHAALEQMLDALDRNGFLAKGNKEAVRREKVALMWQRFHPTKQELDFLSGALRALVEKVGT